MATKKGNDPHWIENAHLNKGAFGNKAKAAGMSTQGYANKVIRPGSGADTTTKRQGNLAKTLGSLSRKKR